MRARIRATARLVDVRHGCGVLLIADTHLRGGELRAAGRQAGRTSRNRRFDHPAGDVTDRSILRALEVRAGSAVLTATTVAWCCPSDSSSTSTDANRSGARQRSPWGEPRLRRWSRADVVVFGHSPAVARDRHHASDDAFSTRQSDQPCSAAAPHHTAAILLLHDGAVDDVTHVVLP